MALYDYQRRAVDQTWAYIRQYQGNPCIVIPTGGGKTHVIAQMISDCLGWKKQIIVATHTIGLLADSVPLKRGLGSSVAAPLTRAPCSRPTSSSACVIAPVVAGATVSTVTA